MIQAAMGRTTLSMDDWLAAVGSTEPGYKLPKPVWNQLFKMSDSTKLHAQQWYRDNRELMDRARCP
jgi:hypothetical protein